jgi:carbonic anhydrase
MNRLMPVHSVEDIPDAWRDTPAARLLEYHNLRRPFDRYDRAALLIGMCMDHRKQLRIPDQFAYILRAGGANLRPSEFKVSYAIAVGGVRDIALIAHTQCGMSGLSARRDAFVAGLVDVGWRREDAESHFERNAPEFEIGNEIDFVVAEAARIGGRYPGVLVTPLVYRVEDSRLYLAGDR